MQGQLGTRFLLVPALLFALSGAGCSGGRAWDAEQFSPDERIVIRFSHVVAENTPKGRAARMFANLVNERTDGKVEVQVFPNSELYTDDEEIDAVAQGRVHIIAPTTSKLSQVVPQWQVFDLPYAFVDERAVVRAMEGEIGAELAARLRPHQMEVMALWDNGFKQMSSALRPVITPADFAGQRFRVMPNSRVLQEQFRALDAYPVPMAFHLVFAGLKEGQVHGQENTASNIYSKRFYEVQHFMTVSNHGYLGYAVVVNAAFWNSLPEDLRGILTEAMAETTAWVRQNASRINDEGLEALRASETMQIHEQSSVERDLWIQAFAPVYESFRASIGSELLNKVLALRNE